MPFTIVRQDITKMEVDAVVNAANTALQMGGGVCGAIFKGAGAAELTAACEPLAPVQTGGAVITPGFCLPAKYVIHTAGPVYKGGKQGEEAQLRSCYRSSLELALANQLESIAFPVISSGIYGYPKEEALRIATEEIQKFLSDHEIDVFLVVFDREAFAVSEKLLGEVESYISQHYVDTHWDPRRRSSLLDVEIQAMNAQPIVEPCMYISERQEEAEDWLSNLDEPFSATLLRLIDAKGKTDPEVYKRANIDRKLFSKIRTSKHYMPSKRTALALAVALELTLKETNDLLERAGYALSRSLKFDVIVEYFIVNQKYNIFEINEILFKYDQALLGG